MDGPAGPIQILWLCEQKSQVTFLMPDAIHIESDGGCPSQFSHCRLVQPKRETNPSKAHFMDRGDMQFTEFQYAVILVQN